MVNSAAADAISPGEGEDRCAQVLRRIGKQYVLQLRQSLPETGNFFLVLLHGGHQEAGIAPLQPLPDRFRSEGGKERAEDAHVLQSAECRKIEFGNAPRQGEHPLPPPHPECNEHIGKTAALSGEIGKGEVPHRAVAA